MCFSHCCSHRYFQLKKTAQFPRVFKINRSGCICDIFSVHAKALSVKHTPWTENWTLTGRCVLQWLEFDLTWSSRYTELPLIPLYVPLQDPRSCLPPLLLAPACTRWRSMVAWCSLACSCSMIHSWWSNGLKPCLSTEWLNTTPSTRECSLLPQLISVSAYEFASS